MIEEEINDMLDERAFQAADVYTKTRDIKLYEWVSALELERDLLRDALKKITSLPDAPPSREEYMEEDYSDKFHTAVSIARAALPKEKGEAHR